MTEIRSLTDLRPERFDRPDILKRLAAAMPNQGILINTLGLQEAKDSSEIENKVEHNLIERLVVAVNTLLVGADMANIAQAIRARGANNILPAKDNQPKLADSIRYFFAM